jgi:hypothetical protein
LLYTFTASVITALAQVKTAPDKTDWNTRKNKESKRDLQRVRIIIVKGGSYFEFFLLEKKVLNV